MPRQLFLILFGLLLLASSLPAQTIRKNHRTLTSKSDSFFISYSKYPGEVTAFAIGSSDTIDTGIDGDHKLTATIRTDSDSTTLHYANLPFREEYFIEITSPKKKNILILHFNQSGAIYTREYAEQNQNKSTITNPEVFELANIIWLLSPPGQKAINLNKAGTYYQKVIKHFRPYQNHKLFAALNRMVKDTMLDYLSLRENSIRYSFTNGKLQMNGPYYFVFGNDTENFSNHFTTLLPEIMDFVSKSGFRQFYASNKTYYDEEAARLNKVLPVKKMWNWLEKEFPGNRYNSYKIVFSPLIGSTHSTQNYTNDIKDFGLFSESLMFVSGPSIADHLQSNRQKEIILSGIVFTEIDHNYVNQETYRYQPTVDRIFSNRSAWISEYGDTRMYQSPMSIFNEYMTHALFCIYLQENYDADLANFGIKQRITLMVQKRGYNKFREFTDALSTIRRNHKLTIAELYPHILEWCRKHY